MTHEVLVNYLINSGVLKTPRIIKAFWEIDRANFVTEEFCDSAYGDHPLSIGYGVTISQPYVVAFMLELLQPQPNQKILDIGSGSGWTATLLSHIVSQEGMISDQISIANSAKIFAIERIHGLKEFGERNCDKFSFVERGIAKFICSDGSEGLPEEAPFDAIQVAASICPERGSSVVDSIPIAWKQQLRVQGRIVAPVENSIYRFTKKSEAEFVEEKFYGFSFVPLIQGKR